jgi:hypothetical protein
MNFTNKSTTGTKESKLNNPSALSSRNLKINKEMVSAKNSETTPTCSKAGTNSPNSSEFFKMDAKSSEK